RIVERDGPAEAGHSPAVYRFGNFELDVGRYELRRGGMAVKVEKLPFELLRLVVERGGLLVTRDEIAARLWGPTHRLDIEQGINAAGRKARQALEPSPELLGTVVGKGYRLNAEVTRVVPPLAGELRPASQAASGSQGEATHGGAFDLASAPIASARLRSRRWSPGALGIRGRLALAAGVVPWLPPGFPC